MGNGSRTHFRSGEEGLAKRFRESLSDTSVGRGQSADGS